MIKKILFTMAILLIGFMISSGACSAESNMWNTAQTNRTTHKKHTTYSYYISKDKKKVCIYAIETDDNVKVKKVNIPSRVKGKKVTQLGYTCGELKKDTDYVGIFSSNTCVSIHVPDTVTCIKDKFFSGVKVLANIQLPKGLKSISEGAFSSCKQLKCIVIPSKVSSIGSYAFQGCVKLSKVRMGKKCTTIGDRVFSGCSSLKTISLKRVKRVGTLGFSNSGLRKADVSAKLALKNRIFFHCKNLSKLKVPKGSSYVVKNGVLYSKDGKTLYYDIRYSKDSIVIPSSVTQICEKAFYGSGLKRVIVSGTRKIGAYAFAGNWLQEISLANGIEEVKSLGLSGSLCKIVFPSTVKKMESEIAIDMPNLSEVAFDGNSDTFICDGHSIIERNGMKLILGIAEGDSYAVPEGVREVSHLSIYSKLTEGKKVIVTYPSSVSRCSEIPCVQLNDVPVYLGVKPVIY